VTAILAPVVLSRTTRFFDLPIVTLVTLLLALLVSDVLLDDASTNIIGRIDGIVLFSVAIAYILYSLHHNNYPTTELEQDVEIVHSPLKAGLWVFGGIVLLFLG